jgi:hypothetical protein
MRMSLIAVLLFSAISQAQVTPAQSVFHSWKNSKNMVWQNSDHTGSGYIVELKIKIEPKQVTQTTLCTYPDGSTIQATATAKAEVTTLTSETGDVSGTIEILEVANATQKKADDSGICLASLPKGTLNYSFNGGDLVIMNPATQGGIEVVLDTDSN